MISCVCVTSARVRHLEESIACFLEQDYAGRCEMIVLNTCPKQTLTLNAPPPAHRPVRIENLGRVPVTLGDARNTAIEMAQGTHIVTWDDDDAFLPHHLSVIAQAFERQRPDRPPSTDPATSRCQWIWLDKQFWGWGNTIKEIVPGQCPCFAFAKSAWKAVGGYPALSVGEDRGFISKVTQQLPGNRFPVEGTPSFIYRWNNGVYHMSGQGDDRANRPKAIDRFRADALARLNTGAEPRGNVSVKPEVRTNWVSLARTYMERELKKKPADDVCLVELGRLGDIINILPIALHISRTRGKPFVMVSNEFFKLFDGISYATPYPVNLPFHDLAQGMKLASEKFGNVIQCQIYGANYKQEMLTSNFNKESWRLAGYLNDFYNPDWNLLFDRREPTREQGIVRKLFRTSFPKVVTNLTRAVSAPLPIGTAILAKLTRCLWGKFEVVDIGHLKLPYVYDVLGILDRAVLFVTIDTATLHLAAGSQVPMIAMVRDGWVGAEPRFGCVKKFTYSEVTAAPDKVVEAVQQQLCR